MEGQGLDPRLAQSVPTEMMATFGSSRGRVPRQLREVIQRQHAILKIDRPLASDIRHETAAPKFVQGQYGLAYGRWGYRSIDPLAKDRAAKTMRMKKTSGAMYAPSPGMVPAKWPKGLTAAAQTRGNR